MSNEKPESWPLPPSISCYTLHGITIALADALHNDVTRNVSPRTLLKVHGLATAAEVFAGEVASFFGSQIGEDHGTLENLQERYLARDGE